MSEDDPKAAVVVVNWNRKELLLEALASLAASEYPQLSVIVVDNGSRDGSIESVRQAFPDVQIISNSDNRGFAAANNQGIEAALKAGCEYIFLLNNDARVEPETITRLISFAAKTKVGAVAPYILYHDQPDVIWFGGGRFSLWCGIAAHCRIRRKYHPTASKPERSGYLTGCAVLLKAEALRQTGGFDTGFRMYSEDVDLSVRLRRAGWELWAIPDVLAYHRVSSSLGGGLSPLKAYHRVRSNALLIRKHARFYHYPTLLPATFMVGIWGVIKLLLAGRAKVVGASLIGWLDGWLDRPVPAKYKYPVLNTNA